LLLALTVAPLSADLFNWILGSLGAGQLEIGSFTYSFGGFRVALWVGGLITILSGLYARRELQAGGTNLGRAIRTLVLEGGAVDPAAEMLLMAADRAQHIAEVIGPAMARGAWVVSDRFLPSSLVYQGIVRGLSVEVVERVNLAACAGIRPDLVIVLDVDDEVADARRSAVDDRLEREGDRFHEQVRAAYRELARDRGWQIVDANADRDEVAARIAALVARVVAR
jgi:dTMP kinase